MKDTQNQIRTDRFLLRPTRDVIRSNGLFFRAPIRDVIR
jgi:hypothetical protein